METTFRNIWRWLWRRRRGLLLAALVFTALVSTSGEARLVLRVRGWIEWGTRPLCGGFRWIEGAAASVVSGLRADDSRPTVRELEEENAALKSELLKKDEALRRCRRINQQLVDLPPERQRQTLVAEVVGRGTSPYYDLIVVNRGSLDGVKPDQPVYTNSGLVGRVVEVTPRSAQVLLLTDQNSAVGVVIQGAPESIDDRLQGVVSGRFHQKELLLEIEQLAEVAEGDRVLTSGRSGRFPGSMLVGTVIRVEDDPSSPIKRAAVEPGQNPDLLEEVLILKWREDVDDSRPPEGKE